VLLTMQCLTHADIDGMPSVSSAGGGGGGARGGGKSGGAAASGRGKKAKRSSSGESSAPAGLDKVKLEEWSEQHISGGHHIS